MIGELLALELWVVERWRRLRHRRRVARVVRESRRYRGVPYRWGGGS